MTAARLSATSGGEHQRGGPWAARAPLWIHALALLAVIGLLIAWTKPGNGFSSDEGAAMAQARLLERGTWLYDYPLDWLEEAEQARPFVRGDLGVEGVAPYAKHPLYPVLLRAVGADTVGAYGLAVAGTAVAALFAGLLAARMSSRRSVHIASLWLAGLATPLLVDSGMVLAHTLAAATIAACGYCTLRSLDQVDAWVPFAGTAVVVAALGVGLRTEAMFGVAAVAVAVAAVVRSRRAIGLAGALMLTIPLVVGADRWIRELITGASLPTQPNTVTAGFQGRWEGFYATWLSTTYDPRTIWGTLMWAGLVALAGSAVLLRRDRISPPAFAAVAGVVAVVYLLRLALDPLGSVPGLLPTIPVLWTLAWLGTRRGQVVAWQVTGLAAVLGGLAIAATQYSIGGGVEWGGRYFAVLLPLAVPTVVAGAQPVLERLDLAGGALRVVVVSAVVASASIGVLGLLTLRDSHTDSQVLTDRIEVAARSHGTDVVMTPNRLLPQILHPHIDSYDWVAADAPDLAPAADELAAAGVDRIIFVAPSAGDWLPDEMRATWVIRDEDTSAVYDVLVLERTSDG